MDGQSEKLAKFDAVVEKMRDIYVRKNHDYGDSFSESIKEWGTLAGVVRLDDKMRRLKTLVKSGNNLVDESISDTLTDMANYAIMILMEDMK